MENEIMPAAKLLKAFENEKHLRSIAMELVGKSFVIKETKFPDSIDIDCGGTGKRGKVYFNASNPVEAKERIEKFFEMIKYKDQCLSEMGGGKSE